MAYISLFRKYRSDDFDDLVGQNHIVKTISNAIKSGKIAQGYLFCGTRGTGKTTVARIIAKAINCEKGPTDHPCGECSICKSIKDGSCMDVVEMDAASNRSVEDVEKIVESVKYRPVECRYKVYIIDEAHQLSNQAKDAFLKTLEEPPEYVVFILATTEAHKIPVTIRSRCQQFDFKRGSIEDISGRIKYVAEKEGVSITDGAVNLIARNANGSYRDSLSILEQIIAFSGNNISNIEVYNVLGLVEEDVLFKISEAILKGDIKQAFNFGSNLIERGKDIKEVLNNIASFYRDLLAVKINANDLGQNYKSEADNYTEKQLMDIISCYVNAQKDLRLSDQQRLTFELAFMNAISLMNKQEVIVEKQIIREVEKPLVKEEVIEKKEPSLRVIQDTKTEVKSEEKKDEVIQPKRVIDFDNHIRKFWPKFLEYIRRGIRNPQFATCLSKGVPIKFEDNVLTLTFKYGDDFSLDVCKSHIDDLEKSLLDCYKTPIKVNLTLFEVPQLDNKKESKEEEEVVPPDFSEGAEIIEAPKPEENENPIPKDLEVINNATMENSALSNINDKTDNIFEEENSFDNINEDKSIDTEDVLEEDNSINEEVIAENFSKEEVEDMPKEAVSEELLADSPLTDEKYDEHPLYDKIKEIFPDSEEKIIENWR